MISLLLLPLALAQAPAPSVTIPAEVKGQPGRIVRLTAETEQKIVRWHLDSSAADLVPFPDSKIALFSAPKPGRYTVLVWTAAGDVPSPAAKCVVVIGDAPAPPAPAPVDPFARDLQQLYERDSTKDKALHVAQLAVLYREAITFARKAEVATAGDLAERIRTAASSLIPADALVAIRKRVAEEIARELPVTSDAPLDSATRDRAAQLFERIANLLGELK